MAAEGGDVVDSDHMYGLDPRILGLGVRRRVCQAPPRWIHAPTTLNPP